MARKVFFSFHFGNDFWRTQQVRNMNALEGNPLAAPNAWEEVKRKGEASVRSWIDAELNGRSCLIALVGAQTAQRPWVRYEISKAWNDGRGVLGIRVHRLLDTSGRQSSAGANPFDYVNLKSGGSLATLAPLKDPPGVDSKGVYATISSKIEGWIEEAIAIRNRQG